MGKNQITWGIIGCGDVCEVKSGPAFQLVEGSALHAVMRRNAEKAKDFAQRHNVANYYTDANEIINNKNIDTVYIATPPNTHAQYAIAAMQAGKAVYLEKPMAISYEECKKIIEVSRKTNSALYVAYYRRFFPYFLKIKEIIDSDELGTLLTCQVTTAQPPRKTDFDTENPHWHLVPKISGGGYFYDVACHQLDILDFLLGPVEDVNGFFTNRTGIYWVEDTLSASLKFESGVLAACSWTYVANEDSAIDRIEIIGTKGTITFSIDASDAIVLKIGKDEQTFYFEKPKHVEMPMIDAVTQSLLGNHPLASNMESAARTAWVMDKVMGVVR